MGAGVQVAKGEAWAPVQAAGTERGGGSWAWLWSEREEGRSSGCQWSEGGRFQGLTGDLERGTDVGEKMKMCVWVAVNVGRGLGWRQSWRYSGEVMKIQNAALGGGSPRPEEEERPEVGGNLRSEWGCLDPHVGWGTRFCSRDWLAV